MKTLLTQNSKMKKASLVTMNFDLPLSTCIGAGKCKDNCYAKGFLYQMSNVINKHKWNLESSKENDFHKKMDAEIKFFKTNKGLQAVRIHSSGDFYSREYLSKWLTIADMNPDITFYAYTKSVPLFINQSLPDNFRVIFSTGGKYDNMIEEHNLRSCSVVEHYDNNAVTSDDDDSKIVLTNANIQLKLRKIRIPKINRGVA